MALGTLARPADSLSPPLPEERSAALTTSGTAAFELVLRRESLRGSRVLFPAFICWGTFEPLVQRYDLDPVFVDVDPRTRHLDPSTAAEHLPAVDAVVLVHAFGLPAPVEEWRELTRRHDALLVEDCARALGARVNGRPVGSFGDYAIYSFSKVTPLFTGGCLVSDVPTDSLELEPPALDPGTVVKTAYDAVPIDVPFRERLSRGYRALLADGTGGERDGSPESGGRPPLRRLDPVNRWRVKRHLARQFDRELERRRSLAGEIRAILDAFDVDVQPDAPGRADHALPVTVPGDRDALLAFLDSRGHAVRAVWRNPLGLKDGSANDYPGTATLAEQSLVFHLPKTTRGSVARLESDLREFYG